MAPKKKTESNITETATPAKRVTIVRKSSMEWKQLLEQVKTNHWRRLIVTIQLRDKLLAGKPANLDAAEAMIKARGLGDVVEARLEEVTDPAERAKLAESAATVGLCEFHRREGKPGIWFPTNNLKAMIKESWSVLGFRVSERGSRGALAEGTFVYSMAEESEERNWRYLGEKPDGVYTGVAHTTGPSGPVSSIKRHEYVVRPKLTFEVAIEAEVNAVKLPEEKIARMLYHAGEHGLGACRSQGFGMFDVVDVHEVGTEEPVQAA
jgi:hypothetical protein